MSVGHARHLAGVFNESETRVLRDAYLLALHALAITHTVDQPLEARLADLILKIYVTEYGPDRWHGVDAGALAARGVERYLTFYNLEQFGAGTAVPGTTMPGTTIH